MMGFHTQRLEDGIVLARAIEDSFRVDLLAFQIDSPVGHSFILYFLEETSVIDTTSIEVTDFMDCVVGDVAISTLPCPFGDGEPSLVDVGFSIASVLDDHLWFTGQIKILCSEVCNGLEVCQFEY